MIVSLIAAQSLNRVIGVNNTLPWDIPEDMSYFKEKTRGHIIIMGRKTFESFPKPLPKRLHIVISRNPSTIKQDQVVWVSSIEQALTEAQNHLSEWPSEVFVIGGGEIYKQALSLADKIYLTQIDREYEGDAYFPIFDKDKYEVTSTPPQRTTSSKNPDIEFQYFIYHKK